MEDDISMMLVLYLVNRKENSVKIKYFFTAALGKHALVLRS